MPPSAGCPLISTSCAPTGRSFSATTCTAASPCAGWFSTSGRTSCSSASPVPTSVYTNCCTTGRSRTKASTAWRATAMKHPAQLRAWQPGLGQPAGHAEPVRFRAACSPGLRLGLVAARPGSGRHAAQVLRDPELPHGVVLLRQLDRPVRDRRAAVPDRPVGRAAGLLLSGLGVPAWKPDPRAHPIAVPLPRGIAATAALALVLARLADGLARPSVGRLEPPLAAIFAAPGVAPVSERPNHRHRAQRPYTALARRAGLCVIARNSGRAAAARHRLRGRHARGRLQRCRRASRPDRSRMPYPVVYPRTRNAPSPGPGRGRWPWS